MAGDTPREAVANFVEPLQRVVHCVAPAYVNVRGGYHVQTAPFTLTLNDGNPIRLKGSRNISIDITHDYNIVEDEDPDRGPWKVHSQGYIYLISEDDQPFLAYHWHPQIGFDIQFPHVHLYVFESLDRKDLAKMHFPTGRVSIESIVRLLHREFDVEPLRTDFDEILDTSESAFRAHRTWG